MLHAHFSSFRVWPVLCVRRDALIEQAHRELEEQKLSSELLVKVSSNKQNTHAWKNATGRIA